MNPGYDEHKLAELLLYVAKQLVNDPWGGATKVNKVLFFADFAHMQRTGQPITGAVYQKLQHGPAPRRLLPVRDALVADGSAAVQNEDRGDKQQHRLVALRDADLTPFSAEELQTVDSVISELRGQNASQVSELSHQHIGWRLTEMNEDIPYAAALAQAPQVATPTSRRLERQVAERFGFIAS